MDALEKGKLYQVKDGKNWIIAEYRQKWEAGIVHGLRGSDGARSWHEPAKHYWNKVAGGSTVTLDKGMQVRPVTPETLAEIARLKTAIETKRQEWMQLGKELRELCG